MQYAFFNNFYLDTCDSVRISGENPWSVRKCPVCPKSRTPDTLGQLAAVPLFILVFGWRCCDDYSPRKSILGTRTSSRCSLDGVILHANCNDFGAKCKINATLITINVYGGLFWRKNPWSVRKCPDCPGSWTPDTHGPLTAVPLIILVFGWRRCDNYSPRYSTLGARSNSRCYHSLSFSTLNGCAYV